MKALVFAAGGFIGNHLHEEFQAAGFETVGTYRNLQGRDGYEVEMSDQDDVERVLKDFQPDVVVNCAGGLPQPGGEYQTHNRQILNSIEKLGLPVHRCVVLGSAAEYGPVSPPPTGIKEAQACNPKAPYALRKYADTKEALIFRDRGLPVTVARIFNPLGPGMPQKVLLHNLMRQAADIADGKSATVEMSRLDAKRDYVCVKELGRGIVMLASGDAKHDIYNIGSGSQTSNEELATTLLRHYPGIRQQEVRMIETSDMPEAPYASRADTTRMKEDFGWHVQRTPDDIIRDLVEHSS